MLSKLQGPAHPAIPPAIGLARLTSNVYSQGRQPGFLGPAHAPFMHGGPGVRDDMVLEGVSLKRLHDRRSLLAGFDRFRRSIDNSGVMEALDASRQQAFGILTSSRLAEAFDLSHEDPNVRARYGHRSHDMSDKTAPTQQQFLLARRLVEAGARCVTLAFGSWDWHANNFPRARNNLPKLDQGVTALVQDLHERGLDQDVSVVVWGEFGRTPKINKDGGRDHWPPVSCAALAGGGMRSGQVIGSTDRHGGEVKDRPVHFQDVFATLYHNVGINVATATVPDLSGRPVDLVDRHKPIREVV